MPDEPLPKDVTTMSGKEVGAIEVPVFHGTRRSCALAIFEHGFRPTPGWRADRRGRSRARDTGGNVALRP
jgi:hypothetical protein